MRPALLLVDLQSDFLARPGLTPRAEEVVERCAVLLRGFRRLGLPVLHAHTLVRADAVDRMPHRKLAEVAECVRGTPGALPPDVLAPRDGEPVIAKRFYSAFETPALERALESCGADALVVAGLYGHACVRETIVDAYARGLAVLVASDAVGSTEPLHDELSRAWLSTRAATFVPTAVLLERLRTPDGPDPADGVGPAIRAAASAQAGWARVSPPARAAALSRWAEELECHEEDLALLMAEEVGKPVTDGGAEVRLGAALVREIAARAAAGTDRTIAAGGVTARRRPRGVVAAVTPWNNPVLLPAGKIAPALGAGNAVVWKPAPETPRTSAALLESLVGTGLDPRLVGMLGGGAETVRRVVSGSGVDAVTFTGSTSAGRRVAALCARAGIPLQAELGGNNAAIVTAGVDIARLAPHLARAAFANAGQRCTALRRFLVEEAILEPFAEALAAATVSLRIGDPRDPATELGPLVSHAHRDRVAAAVRDAVAGGARILTGGREPDAAPAGPFYEPTILRCDEPAAPIVREETFGPVAVVMGVPDFTEALRLLNDTEYGLVAALFSDDPGHRERFLASAEAGILRVNDPEGAIHPAAPFGGVKASGLGPPEHGDWDLDFYTRVQAVYEPRGLA